MIVAGVLFVFVPVKQADILSTGIVVTIRRRYQDMKKADTLPYPHLYFINGRNECAIYEPVIAVQKMNCFELIYGALHLHEYTL